MKNKVIIKLILPELGQTYDIFIPVNEIVWKIKKMLIKSISDLTGVALDIQEDYILMNKDDSKVYDNNEIIINTNIRNGSELILITNKK